MIWRKSRVGFQVVARAARTRLDVAVAGLGARIHAGSRRRSGPRSAGSRARRRCERGGSARGRWLQPGSSEGSRICSSDSADADSSSRSTAASIPFDQQLDRVRPGGLVHDGLLSLARYLSLPRPGPGRGRGRAERGPSPGYRRRGEAAASGREANRVPDGYLRRRPVEARKMSDPPDSIGRAAFSPHRPPGALGCTSHTRPKTTRPRQRRETELTVAERLVVRGAREHNLKDVSLDLPRDAMIVFTGLSGSGKSSLAFDTIFAEGQRRYVESLSAYARQFLGQMDKPDVDFIDGLSPAVSIDQKAASRNPRSTVGTVTEVYDYLRLLFARIGKPHCPECGRPIARQTPQQIVDRVLELDEGTRFQVLAPVIRGRKGEYTELLRDLQTKGYSRARVDGVTIRLDDATDGPGTAAGAEEVREAHDRGDRRPARGARSRPGGGSPTRSRPRSACPAGSSCSTSSTCRTPTRTGSGCTPSTWPACTTTCRSRSLSRGRSRSTRPGAPARTAPAWAPRWRSTPSWWSPTRTCRWPTARSACGAAGTSATTSCG